jgi:hypothetical protein
MLYISATGFLDADRGSVGIQKKDGYQNSNAATCQGFLQRYELS